jgi:hypothetical protein
VAVLDAGVSFAGSADNGSTADLPPNHFTAGYNFVNNTARTEDDNGHGTYIAAIIGQATGNRLGAAGIAFGVSIMPVKVVSRQGIGYASWIAEGVYYAVDHGASVINLSLGGPDSSSALLQALQYASAKHVTTICSAGNDGDNNIRSFPAAFDADCIAVAALRVDGTRAPYSSKGPYVDIVAPGGDVTIDRNNDGLGDGIAAEAFDGAANKLVCTLGQGTSAAAAHISAIVALVLSKATIIHKTFTPDDVRDALEKTAIDLGPTGRDDVYGCGMVDAVAALNWQPHPLARHDGAIGFSPPLAAWTVQGHNLPVSIELTNRGNYTDTFSVLLIDPLFNDTLQRWNDLWIIPALATTMAYTLNTQPFVVGLHDLKAVALLKGFPDANPSDNEQIQSVEIKKNTHDVAVTEINAAWAAAQGTIIKVLVTAGNNGAWDESATMNLYDRSDNILIGSQSVIVSVDEQAVVIFEWNTAPASISDHILDAEVVVGDDSNLSNNKNSAKISVTARSDLRIHVESIDVTVERRIQGKDRVFSAKAVVVIQDSNDNPVEEARLSGVWSGAVNSGGSGLSSVSGIAVIRSADARNISPLTPFIFTVQNVVKSDILYSPAENLESTDAGKMK